MFSILNLLFTVYPNDGVSAISCWLILSGDLKINKITFDMFDYIVQVFQMTIGKFINMLRTGCLNGRGLC